MEKTQVQKEFEAFSAVPRCSFHNEKAIDYVIGQAKQLGLEYYYDEACGNVLIRKPAMIGKRDRVPVILQGHLDMVPQVAPGYSHDFETEPLDLKTDGDWYYAEGTTLGADDGISVALALALLKEPDLKNPPIEVLFTTDEEVGMRSVKNADFGYLKGKYLINLDHGEEDMLVIGCCGGISANFHLPLEKETAEGKRYVLRIDGLAGGHSGIEIDKERANAIKLMAHFLLELSEKQEFRLLSFDADGKDNAISNHASVELLAPADAEAELKKAAREMQKTFRHIFRTSDPKIRVTLEVKEDYAGNAFSAACARKLISFLVQLPFGVIKREQTDFTKPETSANIGVVETKETQIDIIYSIRSSVSQRGRMFAARARNLAEIFGMEAEISKEYPAWLPDPKSPLVGPFKSVYKELYGEYPKVDSVHAGLECGYIIERSGIETAISVGVNIIGEHTTAERLSISSLNRTYQYLRTVIEKL